MDGTIIELPPDEIGVGMWVFILCLFLVIGIAMALLYRSEEKDRRNKRKGCSPVE